MKNLNQLFIKTCLTFMALSLLGYALKTVLIPFSNNELQISQQKSAYIQSHQALSQPFLLPQIQSIQTFPHATTTHNFNIYLPLVTSFVHPKKGIAAASPSTACEDMEIFGASWYYNWDIYPDPACSQKKFIPMLYDANHMIDPYFSDAIKNAQVSGWLMGFNEPNLSWVGNVSPEEGAIYWKHIENVALPLGIKLISPAPNPWDPRTVDAGNIYGHQWIWAMGEAYQRQNKGRKPHFDALSWHMYDLDSKKIIAFLNKRHEEAIQRGYDVPFWVTEYSAFCTDANSPENPFNEEVMVSVTTWMNQTPWIGRYSWFANRIRNDGSVIGNWHCCSLVNPQTGNLTKIGQIYQNY